MNIVKLSALALSALFLSACATPDVVSVRQIGDEDMSCGQLGSAIADTERFEKEAREDRKVTGKNVAAAVFFWPALIGTAMNTEEAIDAAKERRERLLRIYEEKGC